MAPEPPGDNSEAPHRPRHASHSNPLNKWDILLW
jgi:hypothetical protein